MAIVLSTLTFYFSNLRKTKDLAVKVEGWEFGALNDASKNSLIIKVVFFNKGNTSAVIQRPNYCILTKPDYKITTFQYYDSLTEKFPLIIYPSEVKIVSLIILPNNPVDYLPYEDSTSDGLTWSFHLEYIYTSIDWKGKEYGTIVPVTSLAFIFNSKNGFYGVQADSIRNESIKAKEDDSPLIELFH
jgi:hypothetical protein